jgi:hypothetical protein
MVVNAVGLRISESEWPAARRCADIALDASGEVRVQRCNPVHPTSNPILEHLSSASAICGCILGLDTGLHLPASVQVVPDILSWKQDADEKVCLPACLPSTCNVRGYPLPQMLWCLDYVQPTRICCTTYATRYTQTHGETACMAASAVGCFSACVAWQSLIAINQSVRWKSPSPGVPTLEQILLKLPSRMIIRVGGTWPHAALVLL